MSSPYRILTFDIVGTLIDFERGLLDCWHEALDTDALGVTDGQLLEAFARAEDVQHELTPDMPWADMLAPVYRRMAEELNLPCTDEIATSLRASIPSWPAFSEASWCSSPPGRTDERGAMGRAADGRHPR